MYYYWRRLLGRYRCIITHFDGDLEVLLVDRAARVDVWNTHTHKPTTTVNHVMYYNNRLIIVFVICCRQEDGRKRSCPLRFATPRRANVGGEYKGKPANAETQIWFSRILRVTFRTVLFVQKYVFSRQPWQLNSQKWQTSLVDVEIIAANLRNDCRTVRVSANTLHVLFSIVRVFFHPTRYYWLTCIFSNEWYYFLLVPAPHYFLDLFPFVYPDTIPVHVEHFVLKHTSRQAEIIL